MLFRSSGELRPPPCQSVCPLDASHQWCDWGPLGLWSLCLHALPVILRLWLGIYGELTLSGPTSVASSGDRDAYMDLLHGACATHHSGVLFTFPPHRALSGRSPLQSCYLSGGEMGAYSRSLARSVCILCPRSASAPRVIKC